MNPNEKQIRSTDAYKSLEYENLKLKEENIRL